MEDIVKGSKLNSWRIKEARQTFQIQAYLGLRNDGACTAGWAADEATHGETEARRGWNN